MSNNSKHLPIYLQFIGDEIEIRTVDQVIITIAANDNENIARTIRDCLNVTNESGLTPRELLDRVTTYEKRFIEISALLARFTNNSIELARNISDNPLGEGFKYSNPLQKENAELLEQWKELQDRFMKAALHAEQLEVLTGQQHRALEIAEKLIRGYVPANSESYEIITEALAKGKQ